MNGDLILPLFRGLFDSSGFAAALPFPVEELAVSFLAVCAFLPCVLLTDWLVRAAARTVSRATGALSRKGD